MPALPRAVRRRIGVLAAVAVAGLALLVTACGGSGAATTTVAPSTAELPDTGPTTTTESTTTTTTTTTTTPRRPTDELTRKLAEAVPLRAQDFPGGWRVHSEGGVRTLTTGSCSYREGGPEAALGTGAVQDGPTMQLGGARGFITSTGYVFPDEAAATTWLETVRSEEWAACRAEQLTRFQDDHDTGIDVRLDTREVARLGENGFEGYAQFYGYDADDSIALVVNVMHYRLGKVVLEDTLERSIELDDADWVAVDNAHGAAVASAWTRLNDLPAR